MGAQGPLLDRAAGARPPDVLARCLRECDLGRRDEAAVDEQFDVVPHLHVDLEIDLAEHGLTVAGSDRLDRGGQLELASPGRPDDRKHHHQGEGEAEDHEDDAVAGLAHGHMLRGVAKANPPASVALCD